MSWTDAAGEYFRGAQQRGDPLFVSGSRAMWPGMPTTRSRFPEWNGLTVEGGSRRRNPISR